MRRASLRRWAWHPVGFIVLFATVFSGCAGNGCSCMTPIPGGFPAAKRTPNAAQVRVSQTGINQITKDPAALISALVPGGLTFDVPASCGGSPAVCCPGGTAVSPCGPIAIDLSAHPGDDARLEVEPQSGASRIDITVRARVKTQSDVPVNVLGADCGLAIDTAPGPDPDIQLDIPVGLKQDGKTGTTRIDVPSVTVTKLTTDDVKLNGGVGCFFANLGLGFFIGTLTTTFQDAIKSAINDQACKKCPSGDVAECGSFATACTKGVCQEGSVCLQELGVTGRLAGNAVLGGLSPGTVGSIDLYEVAGGYATTDNGGAALGLLGGMVPSGAPRDRCGPPAAEPAAVTIPVSSTFQGNKAPTGDPFDIAIGVHKHQLDRFAYAGYDGGLMCLTVGTSAVDLINSDTFGLFLRSLSNLTSNDVVPMALGIRPQAPPTIKLGKNTFVDDGNGGTKLGEPLLDVKFAALEIDIFAQIEGQYVRLFTLVSDLDLPIGLTVGAGGDLTPVLGDLNSAFTNLSVKNSDPMIESPDDLAKVFPMILQLALPKLAGGLGSFKVPTVGGLQIDVTSITAVDNDTFLAIFGNLKPAAMAFTVPVETTATIAAVDVPPTIDFADPDKWTEGRRPRIAIELGGSEPDLEWQTRIDEGLWSSWSATPRRALSSDVFWLQGKHVIDVRARRRGQAFSVDPTPVVLTALIDTQAPVARIERVGDNVLIDGRDAVSKDRITVRWRLAGGAWREAMAPVETSLAGAAPEALEIQLVDEAGNVAPARGTDANAVSEFHGTPGMGGGCTCGANGGGGGEGAGAVVLVVGFVMIGGRRRRRALRAVRRALPAVLMILIGGSLEACSCSNNPCGAHACLPGEVSLGAVGRWNAIASDGTRTVATTYDQTLGDLVLVELAAGKEPRFTPIDGVPVTDATYDPSTYRGGISDPGNDVGAFSSVALAKGRVRAVSQDRDRKALRYVAEDDRGHFSAHDVDVPMEVEQIGAYASIAIDADGRPAIAYIATGLAGDNGTRITELRLARASSATPGSSGDWTITTVATGVRGCAGLCGSGESCVKSATAGQPETCVSPSADCDPACGNGKACVATACLTVDANEILALPGGVGMFANLIVMPADGRLAIIHYDQVRTALIAELETAPGASTFTETVVDGADASDRGVFASAVVDAGGTIHIAYQEALGDQLFYTTMGAAPGTPELVDDGVRAGDRTHNVGAGATIWLEGGTTPTIAYQDGTSSDLVIASKSGTAWSYGDTASTAIQAGFHIAAPPTGGWLIWDAIDKNASPASTLQVKASP